jgi:hypothetical protein
VTEADWNSSQDPQAMLAFLRDVGKLSEQKARLFAVTCCRRLWELLKDERTRRGVEVAVRFADGTGFAEELSAVWTDTWRAYHDTEKGWLSSQRSVPDAAFQAAMLAAQAVAWVTMDDDPRLPHADGLSRIVRIVPVVVESARYASYAMAQQEERAPGREHHAQVFLLRDLFGPLPFRPVPVAPVVLQWRDGTVVRLAQAAYEQRSLPEGRLDAFRLAVLADALEEAGCQDEEVLTHLREQKGHWRGCWMLDLLLGKT